MAWQNNKERERASKEVQRGSAQWWGIDSLLGGMSRQDLG